MHIPDDKPDVIDDFTLLLGAINYPQFNFQLLSQMSTTITKATSFREALSGFNWYFPLMPLLLQLMANSDDYDSDIIEHCTYFTLYSYITWRLYVEYTNNFENLPQILDALAVCSESSNSKLVIQVYIQSIQLYLSSTAPFDFSYIYPSLCEIFQQHKKQLPALQVLFCPILKIFLPQQDSPIPKDAEVFLSYLSSIQQDNPENITAETATSIIERIYYHISILDSSALNTFSVLCPRIDKTTALPLCALFPTSLSNLIRKNYKFVGNFPAAKTNLSYPTVSLNSALSLHFVTKPTFETQMKPQLIFTFDFEREIGKLITPGLKNIIDAIAISIISIPGIQESTMNCFNTIMKDLTCQPTLEFIASVIYLSSIVNVDQEHTDQFIKGILQSPLFNSSYSAFDAGPDFEQISQLRGELITIIAHRAFTGIVKLFDTAIESPLIFSEIFFRVMSIYSMIPIEMLKNKLLIRSITNASVVFAKLHAQVKDETAREIIEATRYALFDFISRSLAIPTVYNEWYSNSGFINFFIASMFEDPVRPFVIEKLRKYIASQNDFSSPLISSFISTIEILLLHFPDEPHVNLALQLLGMTNNMISQKSELAQVFKDIINSVLMSLSRLVPEKDVSYAFFIEALKFINLEHDVAPLSPQNNSALEMTTLKLRNPQYVDQIKSLLVQIFTNDVDKNHISNINVYRALFKDCEVKGTVNDWIIYTNFLVMKSLENTLTFHSGEIDLFFLNLVENANASRNEDKQILDILQILKRSLQYAASPEVVQKFIGLLMPIEKNFLSIYFQQYFEILNEIIIKSSKFPRKYLSLPSQSNLFEFSSIPTQVFENGCKIAFTLLLEPFECQNIFLFSVSDVNTVLIESYIQNNQLFVKFGQISFSSPIDAKYGSKINFVFAIEPSTFHIYVNEKEIYQNQHTLNFSLIPSYTIEAGNAQTDKNYPMAYFTSFAVFDSVGQTTYFEVNMHDESQTMILPLVSVYPEIKFTLNAVPLQITNFYDVLIDKIEIKSLIFLFGKIGLTDVNGKTIPNLSIQIVDLFISLLKSSDKAQETFLQRKLSGILYYLISNIDAHLLTYEFYSKLYELMETATIPKLKHAMLKNVIIDLSLWSSTSPENLSQITSCWINTLIPKYQAEVVPMIPIYTLLQILQDQYMVGTEASQCTMHNVEQLIKVFSQSNFDSKTFVLFIGQCITTDDPENIKLLLRTLKSILEITENAAELQQTGHIISLLHMLMRFQDPEILFELIGVIILLHKKEIINSISLDLHATILMREFDSNLMKSETIDGLIKIISENIPEFIPMALMIMVNLESSMIDKYSSLIDFSLLSNFTIKEILWLAIAFGRAGVVGKKKFLGVLFNSHPTIFRIICSVMQAITIILGINPSELLIPYIEMVISEMEKGNFSAEIVQKNIASIFCDLLFRPSTESYELFEDIFMNTPFSIPPKEPRSQGLITINSVFDSIKNTKDIYTVFKPRFINGVWADYNIALSVLSLHEKYFDINLINFDIVLTTLAIRTNSSKVLSHIKFLLTGQNPSRANQQLLFLMCSRAASHGVPIRELQPLDPYNAYSALYEFASVSPGENMPKQVVSRMQLLWDNSGTKAKKFLLMTTSNAAEGVTQSIDELHAAERQRSRHCEELWVSLLKEMVQPKGTWAKMNSNLI